MYRITDNMGTKQTAWRWRDALDWLRYCGSDATVSNRITGRVLARRVVA